jgi:4-hydroxy-2-oxoglutarate aldolase
MIFSLLGSNGESKSMTEDEKLKVLEIVIREKGPHQKVMAGTGYETTRPDHRFFQEMPGNGGRPRFSVVSPPSISRKPDRRGHDRVLQRRADALNIPVFAYNVPGFTGMTLTNKVIEGISKHPNIAGLKDSSPAGIAGYLNIVGDDFRCCAARSTPCFYGL